MSFGKMNTLVDIAQTAPVKDAEGFVVCGDTVVATVRAYREEKHANVTKVKAAHMRSLRIAINNIRDFYGLSAVSWSEDIVSGKTYVKNWPFHVLELCKAIEQLVDFINGFDVTWANKLPDPAWIPITTGRPQAAVMQQLQTLILGL